MSDERHTPASETPEYEPPQVEKVLDRDELTREVLYAGTKISACCT